MKLPDMRIYKASISGVLDKYFDPNLDFRAQIFNSLGFLGCALGFFFGVYAIFNYTAIWNVLGNFGAGIAAVAFIAAANRTGAFKLFFLLTVVFVFIILFPVLCFAAGGYKSGMPCFFVFAVVFTVIMLEGRRRTFFVALELALYLACFTVAYYRPETVAPFPTEAALATDIAVGFLLASAVLFIAIHRHIVIYDLKEKELKKANDALSGLNRMKTEFLQNISHELKTPLTVIGNYALDTLSELREENLNVPEMEFNQNRIRAEGERLKRMVSQLLNVTAIEAGRTQIKKEWISLAALLRRVADSDLTPLLNENGNRAVLKIQEGLPEIAADPDAVEQVLLNLLSNAALHTRQGVVTLSLSASEGWQEVRVSDTGEGISPEVLSQVFLRYVERERHAAGRSGLGLYICKKHIDAHGGETGIESQPGGGTAVWFRLPAKKS